MKAVYLQEPWKASIREMEMPKPKAGEALIKVRALGICGSDIASFRGTSPLVRYPLVIGHEIAGEIVELPQGYDGQLAVGSHVIVDPYLYCGSCYPCGLGRTNCCESLQVLGVHRDGGMAEYIAHPAHMLHPVPLDMPWENVPLCEPLTIALHGLHRARLGKGEYIAIYGAGAIGLLAVMAARFMGAIPIVLDRVGERLQTAERLGAAHVVNVSTEDSVAAVRAYTQGRMAQVAMEASGANAAVRDTLSVVCHAGRIALTGWPKKPTELPTDRITFKELDIFGARNSAGEFPQAIGMIHSGSVDAGSILSQVVTLEEVPTILPEIERNPDRYLKVNALLPG